jgi:regulator of protease activity HflC (stomatin/prohibitin superfamily)
MSINMASTCFCCGSIPETEYGILQRFGKFVGVLSPGLACFVWPCTNVAGTISTKLRQIVIRKEAKTKENVFVTLSISIQYLVEPDHIKLAFYSMEHPHIQMESFVEDAIRSIVPTMELEHLFLEKEKISSAIKNELAKKMTGYGWTIVDTLITDIDPEAKVKAAMNKINEAKRLREAAEYEAETAKLVKVKEAEAESVSKRLQGEGVANQRKAILMGLQEGVEGLSKATGVTAEETMKYTMMTQYFDMLREIGTSPNKSTIFIPHVPGAVGSMGDQFSQALMETKHV